MTAIDLLHAHIETLKLHGIRQSLGERLQHARDEQQGYDRFLGTVLEDEVRYRDNARIVRLIKSAGFRLAASCEGVECSAQRNLDKQTLLDLSTCRFVREGANVLISGATGAGKTYLATALGNAACRHGLSVQFMRMNTLLEKLILVRAQNSYLNLVRRLGVVDLLILDDFGIKPLAPQQYQDLYDILDERADRKSTVLTTQLPVENWGEVISDPVTCEAITDRIVSRAITLHLKGESYRKKPARKVDAN